MLKINPEFKNLIPPLTSEEYNQLEKNLLENGCLDTIKLWGKNVIDGHNRYEICTKHNIKFNTEVLEFDSDAYARIWIRNNQKGRRNLSLAWHIELGLGNKDDLALIGKENMAFGGKTKGLSLSDKPSKHNTREEVAKNAGVSTGQVGMAEQVKKKAPELWEKAKAGDISIKAAYTELKAEEKQKAKEERIEVEKNARSEDVADIDIRKGDFKKVLSDVYDIDFILTDPPYPEEYLDCFSDLSKFASEHLKKDGFVAVYSGQYHLPEVIKRLSEHLTYVWTFCLYHIGKKQLVNGVNIMCGWKPVLIFSKGKKKMKFSAYDVLTSEAMEKHSHEWQQSESGASQLIEIFSNPKDLIVDPFAGSGTFNKVAKEMGRKSIGAEIK